MKYWVFIGLFLVFLGQNMVAQESTMLMNKAIVPVFSVNPALKPICKGFISLPALGGLQLGLHNTGFAFQDAILKGTGSRADSFVIDVDAVYESMARLNYLRLQAKVNLLSFGFSVKDKFFTLEISNNTEARVGYARDILSLKDGNWDRETEQPRDLVLDGLGVDVISYNQIAAGMSWQVHNQLRVGGRVKYLMGVANLDTQSAEARLYTDAYPLSLLAETNYSLSTSMPLNISYAADGLVNGVELTGTDDIIGNFVFNKNRGWAFDAGFYYEYTDDWSFEGSLLDIGYINWRSNTNSFTANGQFQFDGVNLDVYETQSANQPDLLQMLRDSVINAFQFDSGTESYRGFISGQAIGAANYHFSEWITFSGLLKLQFYERYIDPAVTLGATIQPKPWLSAGLCYSYMNRSLSNVGFSLALGSKGAQFYIISDNIPVNYTKVTGTPAIIPLQAHTLNLRLGLNILLGCDDKDKSKKGKPGKYCPAYN